MSTAVTAILDVLKLAERLKFELRHSWLSNGRQESVAEHSYQMALMATLIHPHLEHEVNLLHALKMILIHDLVEAEAGDVPFFEKSERKEMKAQREAEAISTIRARLPEESAEAVFQLWYEFEDGKTIEAQFARALDHLEVQLQHNLASLSTWEEIEYGLVYTKMDRYCEHDRFLRSFCDRIKQEATEKLETGGIDVIAVQQAVAGS